MSRRARIAALVLGVVAAVPLAVWSVAIEPGELVVTTTRIALPRWPGPPLRIVALSDIHAGAPHVDVAKLRKIVAAANAENPDLIVLLGDYVIHRVPGGSFIPPEVTAHELRPLRARLGVYGVLGNHDHWLDGPRVSRAFVAEGIPMLDGEAVRIDDRGDPFWLIGIPDIWTRWPDVPGLLKRVPKDAHVLALTHNPDIFPSLPPRIDLLLAGHTHGGQVSLPGIGAPIVPSSYGRRFTRGHIVEDGRHLFVTPGIGTSILPVRFRVPPEISVVALSGETP
jgi:predicted MPP superfamily phosphohydrolase